MDQPRLSPFPSSVWLGYWEHVRSDSPVITICRRQVAFYVGFMGHGHAAVRWIRRGRERRYEVDDGAVRFCPADGERHTLIASHDPGNSFYVLVIPEGQMQELAASDGIASPVEWHHQLCPKDPVLQWCMQRLSSPAVAGESDADGRKDEAARRLLLRIFEVHGAGVPSWRRDTSGFDRRTLADLVAYIDDHLRPSPRLVDMGPLVALSPSHFARKFRQSTGLSLHRFVNYRRVQASFPLLRGNESPLAHVATDLGFSSQSHFTQFFSRLTGMSPAKYRKQFKPCAIRGAFTRTVTSSPASIPTACRPPA